MVDDSKTWWTVPQACVWIRTLDQHTAQGWLGPRETLSLSLAEGAVPGAIDARICLMAALKAECLSAWGRKPGTRAAKEIPPAFWQGGGEFTDDPIHGVKARLVPGRSVAWTKIVVRADDCMAHWRVPASVLAQGPIAMSNALHDANVPEDRPHWFLERRDVKVTGLINSQGQRVQIDPTVFATGFTLDRINNALETSDGHLRWSAVMVELATEPGQAHPDACPAADELPILPNDDGKHYAAQVAAPAPLAQSAQLPTYPPAVTYSADRVPEEFTRWAHDQHKADILITEDRAQDAMRGPEDDAGHRRGGLLIQGVGLSRDTIRKWVSSLPEGWRAKQGVPPSRQR
jgi:hypothetical protein